MKTLLVIFSVFSLISVFCFFWDRALKANERERQYRAECEEHDKKMQAAAKKREKEEAQKAARAQRAAESAQRAEETERRKAEKHAAAMQRSEEKHTAAMQRSEERHAQRVRHAKELAALQPPKAAQEAPEEAQAQQPSEAQPDAQSAQQPAAVTPESFAAKHASPAPHKARGAFAGQTVAFTGRLYGMPRAEAIKAVQARGGRAFAGMPAGTTLLVVGTLKGDGNSRKLEKADEWIGQVRKITEKQFFQMLEA